MNNQYKKAILLLGIVLPVIIIGIVMIVVITKIKSFDTEYTKKCAVYETFKMDEINSRQMKSMVAKNSENLTRWKSLVGDETRGSIIQKLNDIQSQYDRADIKKISQNWSNNSSGIGLDAAQPASQLKMSFVGTYRAMQLSMLEFETELPSLQLDSVNMKPLGGGNLISFDTTFTLWTKQ